mmetsp:Transcript_86306/g.186511  ORF Transcript_86306/g.186511 Transcript_86306/m.186511 type:complete len:1012 (+) Transcript_86306:435-3470(+)
MDRAARPCPHLREGRLPLERGHRQQRAGEDFRARREAGGGRHPDHQLLGELPGLLVPPHRHLHAGPGPHHRRQHAALQRREEAAAAPRGPRRRLRERRHERRRGPVGPLRLLRAEAGLPGDEAPHHGRHEAARRGHRRAVQGERRGPDAARGPWRLRRRAARQREARRGLHDHQGRLPPDLRCRDRHDAREDPRLAGDRLHLKLEPEDWRRPLRESQGSGHQRHRERARDRGLHHEQPRAARQPPGDRLHPGEALWPPGRRRALPAAVRPVLRLRRLPGRGHRRGAVQERPPPHAADHPAVQGRAGAPGPALAHPPLLHHDPGAARREAERHGVRGARAPRGAAGAPGARGEVAQGGQAGVHRGARRHRHGHGREVRALHLPPGERAPEGHRVLRAARPDRPDRRLREEGGLPGRLLPAPAGHARLQPRGRHQLREGPPRGLERPAAHRHQRGREDLHGAEQAPGDHLHPPRGPEGEQGGPGPAPDAAPGDEPAAGAEGRGGHPADEHVHTLRPQLHRPALREGGPAPVGRGALPGHRRHQARAAPRAHDDAGVPHAVLLEDAAGQRARVPHGAAAPQPPEPQRRRAGRHQVPRADRRPEDRRDVRGLRIQRGQLLLPRCDFGEQHRQGRALQVHPGRQQGRQHAGGRARLPREHLLRSRRGQGLPEGGEAAGPQAADLRLRPARLRRGAHGLPLQELADEVHRGLRREGQPAELPRRHRLPHRPRLLRGLHQVPAAERPRGLPHRAPRRGGGEAEPPPRPPALARGARRRGQPGPLPPQRHRQDIHRHEQGPRDLPEEQRLLRLGRGGQVLRGPRPAPGLHRLQARVGHLRPAARRRHEPQRPLQAAGALPRRAPEPGALGDRAQPGERVPPPGHRPGRGHGPAGVLLRGRGLRDRQGLHQRRSAQRAHRASGEDRLPQVGRLQQEQEPPEPPRPHGHQGRQDARHGLHQPPGQLRRAGDRQDRAGRPVPPVRGGLPHLQEVRPERGGHGHAPDEHRVPRARAGVRRALQ